MNTVVAIAPTVCYKLRTATAQLIAYYTQAEFDQAFFPTLYPAGCHFISTGSYIAIMDGIAIAGLYRGVVYQHMGEPEGSISYIAVWLPSDTPITVRYTTV